MLKIPRPDGGDWPLPSPGPGLPAWGGGGDLVLASWGQAAGAQTHPRALLSWLMLVTRPFAGRFQGGSVTCEGHTIGR